jgi:hypothetical protein
MRPISSRTRQLNRAIGVALLVGGVAADARAQSEPPPRLRLSVEAASVWQQRNDVRIPPDTGTEFSIVDLIGSAPTPSIRVEATARLTQRQELRFVYAPLRVSGRGTPTEPIFFAGGQFATIPTDAEYQFTSYRVTWRYRVYQGRTWTWSLGATAFVRDARIALSQPGEAAEDTDVGFVPLAHLRGDARLGERWLFSTEVDGSAAPQGRAFDVAALLNYRVTPRLTIGGGYRTVEGGADVDAVYTFAWIHAAVVKVAVAF